MCSESFLKMAASYTANKHKTIGQSLVYQMFKTNHANIFAVIAIVVAKCKIPDRGMPFCIFILEYLKYDGWGYKPKVRQFNAL